jgi:hypothetical protein
MLLRSAPLVMVASGTPYRDNPRLPRQKDLEQAPRKTTSLTKARVIPGRTVRVPQFPCREGSERILPQLNKNDVTLTCARPFAPSRTAPPLVLPKCLPVLFQASDEDRRRVKVDRK